MDRDSRNLQNRKQNIFQVKTGTPKLTDLSEGNPEFWMINGVMKLVIKNSNKIWYFTGSQDG